MAKTPAFSSERTAPKCPKTALPSQSPMPSYVTKASEIEPDVTPPVTAISSEAKVPSITEIAAVFFMSSTLRAMAPGSGGGAEPGRAALASPEAKAAEPRDSSIAAASTNPRILWICFMIKCSFPEIGSSKLRFGARSRFRPRPAANAYPFISPEGSPVGSPEGSPDVAPSSYSVL